MQLTRDLFAIAKFLFAWRTVVALPITGRQSSPIFCVLAIFRM